MSRENVKQILISIIIGACVAFFTTLFEGLAEFLKTHSTDITSGAASALYYAAKKIHFA